MNNQVTALLIGGTNHGAVINIAEAYQEIAIAERGKLVLLVNGSQPPELAKETYQKLTTDTQGRAIYVIAIVGTTPNETFVNYIFESFITGK